MIFIIIAISQDIKDVYLFGIVGALIIADIAVLLPPTLVSSARLSREQKEFEGNKVSVLS